MLPAALVLALAWGCLAGGPRAQAVTTADSELYGGVSVPIVNGRQLLGMTFVNRLVARAPVVSCSGNVLTFDASAGNLGALLAAGAAYYVEFVSGPDSAYVGDRFDLDVTASRASANSTLTIAAGAENNTLASLPAGAALAGYTAVVRAHVTLGQLFGTKANPLMFAAASAATADQVLLFNRQTQTWVVYYFLTNPSGTIKQWTRAGGGSTNRDGEIIPPGAGVQVVRMPATPVTLYWTGEVRRNHFAQPLVAGRNLVCQPWPLAASPATRLMNFAHGMAGTASATTSDQLQPLVGGTYKVYYLLRNSTGTIEQWTLAGGGSTNRSNETLFSPVNALFLNKINADPDHLVPSPL